MRPFNDRHAATLPQLRDICGADYIPRNQRGIPPCQVLPMLLDALTSPRNILRISVFISESVSSGFYFSSRRGHTPSRGGYPEPHAGIVCRYLP